MSDYTTELEDAIDAVARAKKAITSTARLQAALYAEYEQARVDHNQAKDDYYHALTALEEAIGGDIDPAQQPLPLGDTKNDPAHPDRRSAAGDIGCRRADVASQGA